MKALSEANKDRVKRVLDGAKSVESEERLFARMTLDCRTHRRRWRSGRIRCPDGKLLDLGR